MKSKSVVVHVRVSASEKRQIQRAATRAGLSVSAWLRRIAREGK